MRWVLYGLIGLVLCLLVWGAVAQISNAYYWSAGVGMFVALWGFWVWRWIKPLNLAHDGDLGIGYCITLVLVTLAEALGLVVAFREQRPPADAMVLYLLVSLLGPFSLAWIGWAKRRGKVEGYLFNGSTVTFARAALPAAIFIPCVASAMGFAHALPLGPAAAPEFLLATPYLTKSASTNGPHGVVGVGTAKEGLQVLLVVKPEQFSHNWPALLAIDVYFDAAFQREWRISGASHAFVGASSELVELLVKESSERQRQTGTQWMTHHGFLVPELARSMVGLNAEGTREDLRRLTPLEVVSPEEPTGVETLLLQCLPQGPVVIQIVLERRSSESTNLEIGQSLQKVIDGMAFRCWYR